MELLIFALYLVFTVFCLYKAFSSQNVNSIVFFSLLGMAGCFATGGLLTISGLKFTSGINTITGAFTYSTLTAANDVTIRVLGMIFIILGFIPIYRIFRAMEANGWKLNL